MLDSYSLINPRVYTCEDSEGHQTFCVKGKIVIDDEDLRGKNDPVETIFPGELVREAGEFVQAFRSMLPSNRKWTDNQGVEHDWNGTRELKEGEDFGPSEYREVCKQLAEMKFTTLKRGKFINVPFEQPMVMLYSRNMTLRKDEAGKRIANDYVHKKGHPVLLANTEKTVRVYKETKIFVRCISEGPTYLQDQPISGWSWQERLASKEKMMLPLSEFIRIKEGKSTRPGAADMKAIFDMYELPTETTEKVKAPLNPDDEDIPET